MTELKDIANLIASQGDQPLRVSSIKFDYKNATSPNINNKQKQELKKDWIFFIVRDVIIFAAVIIFVLTVGMYSLLIVFRAASPEDEKKFAISIIMMIMTGLIIFVTARATVIAKE